MRTASPLSKPMIRTLLGVWLLLCGSPDGAAEETLGRLFFTPERRQQLDRQRELKDFDRQPAIAEPLLTVDGIVTRSSGKRTAWINGQPQHEQQAASGLSVTPRRGDPGKVVIRANDLPSASARVGETVNRHSGEAQDRLNGGQVRVHAGAKPSQ